MLEHKFAENGVFLSNGARESRTAISRSFIETAWFREKGLPRRDEGVARLYSRHMYEYVCI